MGTMYFSGLNSKTIFENSIMAVDTSALEKYRKNKPSGLNLSALTGGSSFKLNQDFEQLFVLYTGKILLEPNHIHLSLFFSLLKL